jgi:methyl coenzyme M reductase alpha subunit
VTPHIITAAEARALVQAATPGPWSSLPLTADRVGPDLVVRVRMREGDSDLAAAAPDLAASVVALHAEVERMRAILPPERERGQGIVGEGSWAVFAERVVAERDAAREHARQATAAERARIVAWLRAWADAYEPKYSVYPDDCRDLADRIERGEVTP